MIPSLARRVRGRVLVRSNVTELAGYCLELWYLTIAGRRPTNPWTEFGFKEQRTRTAISACLYRPVYICSFDCTHSHRKNNTAGYDPFPISPVAVHLRYPPSPFPSPFFFANIVVSAFPAFVTLCSSIFVLCVSFHLVFSIHLLAGSANSPCIALIWIQLHVWCVL